MNMKILHTSDWHLGHTLHDYSREAEHQAFLAWLLDTLEAESVDALLICGDVFDNANPAAQSQVLWYRFLAEAQRLLPGLDIVVIGGNHDSAARLDAPDPLLRAFRVRVVGGLPYENDGTINWDRLLIPLHDSENNIAAWVAAMPFLRQADLPTIAEGEADPLIDGVRQRYAEAIAAVRKQLTPGQALVVTGHCYMTGGILSDLSERKILGGNQHALPADIFPDDIAYVALGHLHRPQTVGSRENVRYSGSPLPLSVIEIGYESQICLVELNGSECSGIRQLTVPRAVQFLRIPVRGELPLDTLLAELGELPAAPVDNDRSAWPYLEVAPLLEKPEPALRERIQESLTGKAVRLVRIAPVYTGGAGVLSTALAGQSLSDITPEDVFVRRYRSSYPDDPPPEYLAAFHELIEQVEQREVQP
jgi:exonuclease SbcD